MLVPKKISKPDIEPRCFFLGGGNAVGLWYSLKDTFILKYIRSIPHHFMVGWLKT